MAKKPNIANLTVNGASIGGTVKPTLNEKQQEQLKADVAFINSYKLAVQQGQTAEQLIATLGWKDENNQPKKKTAVAGKVQYLKKIAGIDMVAKFGKLKTDGKRGKGKMYDDALIGALAAAIG